MRFFAKILRLGLATLATFFLSEASASEAPKLSQHLLKQVMRFHKDDPAFKPFGYQRPSPSATWHFTRDDFAQYLFNLHAMVNKIYEVIEHNEEQVRFYLDEPASLMSIIEDRSLGEALAKDLAALEPESQTPRQLSAEAELYMDHIERLKGESDPIYLLYSVYSVVFGHAFGAQSFLKRAVQLGLADSFASQRYPRDTQAMRKALAALIDASAKGDAMDESSVDKREASYQRYDHYLTFEFVLQGSTLRVLDKSMLPLKKYLFLQKRAEMETGISFPFWHRGLLAGPYAFWWMNLTTQLVSDFTWSRLL